MGIVSVEEGFEGQQGGLDSTPVIEHTRVFKVLVDDPETREIAILLAPGIPRVWDTFATSGEIDLGCFCKRVRAARVPSTRLYWLVTAEYDSQITAATAGKKDNPIPTLRPPTVRWSAVRITNPVHQDRLGQAITNSAGDEFDPGPLKDDANLSLAIARNEESYTAATALDFVNSVNVEEWNGGETRCWKCQAILGELQYETIEGLLFPYWLVTYEFEFRREQIDGDIRHGGWDLGVMDRGFHKVAGGDRSKILDTWGQPVSEPVKLDGAGDVLAPGAAAKYRWFEIYEKRDFNQLNLI